MFAAATREVVFSNPAVIQRIQKDFIPVALKAGLVNNPPNGIEGQLYAEIGRSKPAAQGICTTNSDGKVLAWALSFDNENSILKFLDHVAHRYHQNPDSSQSVTAERFRKFPSRKYHDVADTKHQLEIPKHVHHHDCPATPKHAEGTFVGTIVGRSIGSDGEFKSSARQEDYMESRFEISPYVQSELIQACEKAGDEGFNLPDELSKAIVQPAFLGQLDVNPFTIAAPGGENKVRWYEFHGNRAESKDADTIRIRIEGRSDIAAARGLRASPKGGSHQWEHRVTLNWIGFIELKDQRISNLNVMAAGDERLLWHNPGFKQTNEAGVEHLMAGHPIDFNGQVRYGLMAWDEK